MIGSAPIRLQRPTPDFAKALVLDQEDASFTYAEVGQSQHWSPPAGFDTDIRTAVIASADRWDAAKKAISEWAMFHGHVCLWSDGPPTAGRHAVVSARFLGMWVSNVARVVYQIDEVDRFGFAYGTLPAHAEMGEERFLATRSAAGVTFEIRAFSRPRHPLAALVKSLVRRRQHRFALDAIRAMTQATDRLHNSAV